jgi:DNA-directed RNA polymerase subunit E'/Rpb7
MSRSIKLEIESQYLGHNLKNAIYNKLKNLEGTCTKDGCILSVYHLGEIVSATIDRSNNTNIFNVKYDCNTFLPLLDTRYDAIVVSSFPEGSIINVNKCTSVVAIIMNKNLPIGDTSSVILKEIVYTDNKFQCVAQVI